MALAAAALAALAVMASAYNCGPCGDLIKIAATAVDTAMTQTASPTTVQ